MKQFHIIWSPLAEGTYLDTISYILNEFTIKEAGAFEKKVSNLIQYLKSNKKLCPVSDKQQQYHRCVITKQTSLIYQLNDNAIELVAFIDNRSDHSY